jgi:uncharacterized protein YceH (UPF0502 family)
VNDLSAVEARVLGSLLEKQRLTPDAYPLTLNALRLACNQTTSREPVTSFEDAEIRQALDRLHGRGLTRLASGAGSRAPKYRHLVPEALGLDDAEMALLAALLLRGPQTASELRARSERMHVFPSQDAVDTTLETLAGRRLALLQERRPGEKAARWTHLLSGRSAAPAEAAAPVDAPDDRVGRLEVEVAALRAEIAELRALIEGGTP